MAIELEHFATRRTLSTRRTADGGSHIRNRWIAFS
jgi:hypothetical protein